MLSGRCARGSSRAPPSGKIGSRSGRSASEYGSFALIARPPPSREQDRRQATAARHGEFVARTPGVEQLDELLARGLVVQLAIHADRFEQVVERLLAAAGAAERKGEVDARLVVARVGLDGLGEADEPARGGIPPWALAPAPGACGAGGARSHPAGGRPGGAGAGRRPRRAL